VEKEQIQEALLTIRDIEKKMSELENVFSSVSFARSELIEKIFQDIINTNEFLLSIEGKEDQLKRAQKERKPEDLFDFKQLEKVEGDKTKKTIILNGFIENFEGISENDRKAILESLIDKDLNSVKKDILQLSKVFKLKDF